MADEQSVFGLIAWRVIPYAAREVTLSGSTI